MNIKLKDNSTIVFINQDNNRYTEYTFVQNSETGNWEFDSGVYAYPGNIKKCIFHQFKENGENSYFFEFRTSKNTRYYITGSDESNDNITLYNVVKVSKIEYAGIIKEHYNRIMSKYMKYKSIHNKDTYHKELAKLSLENELKKANIDHNTTLRLLDNNKLEICKYINNLDEFNYEYQFIQEILNEIYELLENINNTEIINNVDLIKLMKKNMS